MPDTRLQPRRFGTVHVPKKHRNMHAARGRATPGKLARGQALIPLIEFIAPEAPHSRKNRGACGGHVLDWDFER
jgi:hypothetical protein